MNIVWDWIWAGPKRPDPQSNASETTPMNEDIKSAIRSVVSVLAGLGVGLVLVAAIGESPWHVLNVLAKSAFGTFYDFGMTLFFSTPLVLTGLAVAVPFRAGLFNIGAEGQLTMGALACAVAGIVFPELTGVTAIGLGVAASFLGGAFWGAIPGYLRAVRANHEVITTIMLNFVAIGLSSYVTLYWFKSMESQNPETQSMGAGYLLPPLPGFADTPLSGAALMALILVPVCSWVFSRTVFGYQTQAVGENVEACQRAGLSVAKLRVMAMALGGGLAGLVGVVEVMGNAGKFKIGFSPGYGFMGIAVALLGRGRPLGILFGALLFGALHKGTSDLALETDRVSRDFSAILQALVILSVSAVGLWEMKKARGKAS